jgi:hypothetical protein
MKCGGPVTRPLCPALRRAAAYTQAPGSQRAASPQESREQPDQAQPWLAKHQRPSPAAPLQCSRRGEQTRQMGTSALFGITRDAPSQGPRRSKRSGHIQAILQLLAARHPAARTPSLALQARRESCTDQHCMYLDMSRHRPAQGGKSRSAFGAIDITTAFAPTRARWRCAHKLELLCQAPGRTVAHASASRFGRRCAHARGVRGAAMGPRPCLPQLGPSFRQSHGPHAPALPTGAAHPNARESCYCALLHALPSRRRRRGIRGLAGSRFKNAGMCRLFTGLARRGRRRRGPCAAAPPLRAQRPVGAAERAQAVGGARRAGAAAQVSAWAARPAGSTARRRCAKGLFGNMGPLARAAAPPSAFSASTRASQSPVPARVRGVLARVPGNCSCGKEARGAAAEGTAPTSCLRTHSRHQGQRTPEQPCPGV